MVYFYINEKNGFIWHLRERRDEYCNCDIRWSMSYDLLVIFCVLGNYSVHSTSMVHPFDIFKNIVQNKKLKL